MKYRPLGRGGWEISEVGLGTYPLGGALQTVGSYWSGPVTYGAVSAEAAIATIHAGLAAGELHRHRARVRRCRDVHPAGAPRATGRGRADALPRGNQMR